MIDPDLPYAAQLARRADALTDACVHAGETVDPHTRALETPLVLASAFGFDDAEQAAAAFRGESDALIYGRWGNPTVSSLEAKLAALEGAEAVAATASGMAAVTGALLACCGGRAHVVAPRSMYAESARLLRERLPPYGVTTTFVDGAAAPGSYADARTADTRVFYIETPANPNLAVTDITGVVELARRHGIVTVVDNTFATPFAQNPLQLGADLVVHSLTKALGGHGDAIGGAICGGAELVEHARDLVVKGLGAVLAPLSAFLIARGLKTFALRQEKACATAALLALRLDEHPAVERVFHPSLPSHPQHALACSQMHAFGSLLAFELRGGRDGQALQRGRRVLEGVRRITHAVSLGDARSLLVHPASTTQSTMPAEARRLAGVGDGLLRLSVGLESGASLWADLEHALQACTE